MEFTIESIEAFRQATFSVSIIFFMLGLIALYIYVKKRREDNIKYTSYACGSISIVLMCWSLTVTGFEPIIGLFVVMFISLLSFMYNSAMALFSLNIDFDKIWEKIRTEK